jgi:hypothetical protein
MENDVTFAITIIGAIGLFASIAWTQPKDDSNLGCVKSLEVPTRGLFAARAGVSGTVEVAVEVGKDGQPEKWGLMGDNQILKGEAQVAVSLSRFLPACEGRMVKIVFAFTLEDPPSDSILPPAVRFIPPNRFELTFRRVKPNLDPASPGKTRKKTK